MYVTDLALEYRQERRSEVPDTLTATCRRKRAGIYRPAARMSPSSGAFHAAPRPRTGRCMPLRRWRAIVAQPARGCPSRPVDDCQKGKLADVNSKALKDKGLDSRGVGGVTKKVLSAREISDLVDCCPAIPDHIKASIRRLLG